MSTAIELVNVSMWANIGVFGRPYMDWKHQLWHLFWVSFALCVVAVGNKSFGSCFTSMSIGISRVFFIFFGKHLISNDAVFTTNEFNRGETERGQFSMIFVLMWCLQSFKIVVQVASVRSPEHNASLFHTAKSVNNMAANIHSKQRTFCCCSKLLSHRHRAKRITDTHLIIVIIKYGKRTEHSDNTK